MPKQALLIAPPFETAQGDEKLGKCIALPPVCKSIIICLSIVPDEVVTASFAPSKRYLQLLPATSVGELEPLYAGTVMLVTGSVTESTENETEYVLGQSPLTIEQNEPNEPLSLSIPHGWQVTGQVQPLR